ncbi:DUF1275 family protein [Streptomyces sp. MMS24-I2-30]|uniref:DUF1275 family protein n=1 Tax=Streptomyces sp. MMS24-I2-30 TaxID=3351564 RepID=UPI003896E112
MLALVALVSASSLLTPDGAGPDRGSAPADTLFAHVSIALLTLAAGLQNSTVRHFGVPDLNTSVLTLTLTALTADSALGGGQRAKVLRRAGSVAAMLGGAVVAAALLHVSAAAVAALAAVLVALVAAAFATGRSAVSAAEAAVGKGAVGAAWPLGQPQNSRRAALTTADSWVCG